MAASIIWFRNDLRLADNPALKAAADRGEPMIPVYIWSPDEGCGNWPIGSASRWWLHQSLSALSADLRAAGSQLTVRAGTVGDQLRNVLAETGADCVYWNRRYAPAEVECDKRIKSELAGSGIHVESFNGSLLFEPWELQTKQGRPYQVFTPFSKTHQATGGDWKASRRIKSLSPPKKFPVGVTLDDLELEPAIAWTDKIDEFWHPGETGAKKLLKRFLNGNAGDYHNKRNHPFVDGTSRLSPYLHFGEISPRQIWQAVANHSDSKAAGLDAYLRQLIWRDFAHHILFHFPQTPDSPLRQKFVRFPWETDTTALRAWQRGQTGYPIVDAGMRQLWSTGWMHNRVRMIVGSFLTKDLRQSWLRGAEWFWDTLVDADLPNNTMGWQWVGGCGADAAPYFRVFNPTLQGQKFDPQGTYVREWVPELSNLPQKWIHNPWEAPEDELATAGIELGTSYPHPIVDHKHARKLALEALASIKDAS